MNRPLAFIFHCPWPRNCWYRPNLWIDSILSPPPMAFQGTGYFLGGIRMGISSCFLFLIPDKFMYRLLQLIFRNQRVPETWKDSNTSWWKPTRRSSGLYSDPLWAWMMPTIHGGTRFSLIVSSCTRKSLIIRISTVRTAWDHWKRSWWWLSFTLFNLLSRKTSKDKSINSSCNLATQITRRIRDVRGMHGNTWDEEDRMDSSRRRAHHPTLPSFTEELSALLLSHCFFAHTP